MSIHRNEIVAIADAQHGQPFQVLGPHQDEHGACIRAYHPTVSYTHLTMPPNSSV